MLIQFETQYASPKPRSVFYSYSQKDEDLRDALDMHLTVLKRDGFISTWYDRKIPPGHEFDHVINEKINTADIILLLVSPSFLLSQYCRDIEMRLAMERHEKREAIVVPIILRPCAWISEAFSKLQVLPRNCRPLVEWPDVGFAHVSEELRAVMVGLIYPRLPSGDNEGQHGNWIMKLRSRPELDDGLRAKQVVSHLREFTQDFSINLLATSDTQIADGEKINPGLMLILTGSPQAFSKLSMAQSEGRLAPAISDDIISFYVVHGATVQGSSSVGDTIALSKIDNGDLMLRTGRKIKPPIIKGLVLPQRDDENMHFIINRGDSGYNDEATKKLDYQYLSDYFYTSLVVKDDFQWVNLSAYEADRMLPPELSGTAMGRNLLSQDCMLKRLTASLMHPDSEVGREYWDAVYAEARRLFGTSKLPFRSFHKVTILPIDALIYTPTDAASLQETLSITVPPNASFAYVIRNELGVLCEEDLVAKKYGAGASSSSGDVDFTLELFRKIVLPKIKEEVNEGEHFSEIRRIYSAMLLAAWLKREPQRSKNETIRQLVDSGKTSTRFTITGVKPLHHDKANSEQSVSARKEAVTLVEHVTPNASAFEIPENVEFYAQYIRLFKDGVFRCARNETGDTPDESVIRVYFSGAIDFRNLSEVVKFVRT